MFDTVSILQLPDHKMTLGGSPRQNQPLTVANLEYIIKAGGISLRMNVMLNRFEFHGKGIGADDVSQNTVYRALEDALTMLDIGGLNRVREMLTDLAMASDAYHPMEDMIMSAEWDGVDRLAALAATVPTDSKAWPEYLRKWLIQSVEAVRGWRGTQERSLPHVLVFVGGQGAGKGRWLRKLAPGYVMADAELHLSSFGSKDQQLVVLKYPIVELGEIDHTFKKSEVSALKSFLSKQVDALRAPYARVAVERPRMTVFAGSVNSVEFLNDPTGARRFWPVALERGEELDWDHGIDMQQVFAQINVYWEAKEDWNLEDWSEVLREEEMTRFVQASAAADTLESHYADHRKEFKAYAALNKTDICKVLGLPMHPAALAEVTEWMTRVCGVPGKITTGDGYQKQRAWAFPVGIKRIDLVSTVLPENVAKEHFMRHANFSS